MHVLTDSVMVFVEVHVPHGIGEVLTAFCVAIHGLQTQGNLWVDSCSVAWQRVSLVPLHGRLLIASMVTTASSYGEKCCFCC